MTKAWWLAAAVGAAVASPKLASAAVYDLHVAGVCSQSWTDGKGSAAIGAWANETSVDVKIDLRGSISQAAASLAGYLDQYCGDGNLCHVYAYSAGEAVLGYLLANTTSTWNLAAVYVGGGAAGGSRLAGDIAAALTCSLASQLTESGVRAAYNHNVTGGVTMYRLGGRDELAETAAACVAGTILKWITFGFVNDHCLQGKNDGVVEYHSSAAYSTAGVYADFWDSGSHWGSGYQRSYVTPSAADEGRPLNHYEIKVLPLCLEGGIAGVSGLDACVTWADSTHWQ